jgi:hypothetical protein
MCLNLSGLICHVVGDCANANNVTSSFYLLLGVVSIAVGFFKSRMLTGWKRTAYLGMTSIIVIEICFFLYRHNPFWR